MCPWVVTGLIKWRRASSSITCLGSPLVAVAMDWSVSAPARARIASSAVGNPSSTSGPPLFADGVAIKTEKISSAADVAVVRGNVSPLRIKQIAVLTVVAQQAKSESDIYENGHWPTDGRTVAASVSRWSGSDSSRSTHPGSFDESKSSLVGKPL